MVRWMGRLVTLLFAVVLFAPSLFLLQFQMRRAYIERELCVQREVIAEMRTCHGECHLMKQFAALEQEADAGFPAERLQVREDPTIAFDLVVRPCVRPFAERHFPDVVAAVFMGHARVVDHVPRG